MEKIIASMTFNIVPTPLNQRVFLFQNNFGVLETLITSGMQSESYKVDREQNELDLAIDYNPLYGSYTDTISTHETYNEVYTGFISKEYARHLKELLASRHFFFVDTTRFVKCELIAGTFDITDDEKDIASVKFQYKMID